MGEIMIGMRKSLNELLVHMFNDIIKIEEKALIVQEYVDISIIDLHILEAIGYENSRNMTAVANHIGVTVGTLTIAINNLVKKGYVKRVRSSKDRRVVLISLTPMGQKAYNHHQKFHDSMLQELEDLLQEDEIKTLVKTLNIINDFFETKYVASSRNNVQKKSLE